MRRDKAALIAVEGMTNVEGVITDVTGFREV